MSNRTKQRRSGGLTLLLYQRTLHPELFKILANEPVTRRAYDADIWLVVVWVTYLVLYMRTLARRHLTRREVNVNLSTTGLVHEAYLKLVDQSRVA